MYGIEYFYFGLKQNKQHVKHCCGPVQLFIKKQIMHILCALCF